MHPFLEEIMDYLARVRADLTALVEHTPPAAFDRKPKNGGWTGTGIIQHTGKVEGAATKHLEGLFAKAMAEGMPPETGTVPWLHSLDGRRMLDRTQRIESPERLVPDATAELASSWASLQAVRERLKRALASVDGRDLSIISASHPIFGPLNGYQWVITIGKHEERHLIQLRETLSEA
jgi:hypothetical protein